MSTRRSLLFSFIDRYAGLVITVVSSMVLARLLTPAEIGIFAVAMVITNLLSTVRDLGAGQYLVQERQLSHSRIRAVWAVQLGLGVLIALLLAVLSMPIASFYGDTRIRDIMFLLAFNYLVNPFGSITYAWLMREMLFQLIAIMRFASSLAGTSVSVWLAWKGHGAISLAWGTLAATGTNAAISLLFRPSGYPWLPGITGLRHVLSFGTSVTAAAIMSSLSKGSPEFFLGKLQSFTDAGFFSRANGLVSMFARLVSDAVYSVAFALFAKEYRERGSFRSSFETTVAYVTALGWSFSLVVMFLAHPLTRILYGSQWDHSVELTRLLCVATIFLTPLTIFYAALLAAGATSRIFNATVGSSIVSIGSAALGAHFGLKWVGWAMVFAALASMIIWMLHSNQIIGFNWRSAAMILRRSGLVAVCSSVVPALLFFALGPEPTHSLLVLAIGLGGSAISGIAAIVVCGHPLKAEVDRISRRAFAHFGSSK